MTWKDCQSIVPLVPLWKGFHVNHIIQVVIVAPSGMRGRLTGCCPSDLVNQAYISKHKASKGVTPSMPFVVTRSSGCQLRVQSCYIEVTLGFSSKCSEKTFESIGSQNNNDVHHHTEEAQMVYAGRNQQKQGSQRPVLQKSFIYQPETVLVPLMHKAFARTPFKRFFRKNWPGTSMSELWSLWSFSGSSHIEHCPIVHQKTFMEGVNLHIFSRGRCGGSNALETVNCQMEASYIKICVDWYEKFQACMIRINICRTSDCSNG